MARNKPKGYGYVHVKDTHRKRPGKSCQKGKGRKKMRYEYTVTKEGGEAEIMKAMSWKKLFKSLLIKYPKFSGWCTYINKKGHVQVKSFREGKVTRK
jgi:hypothetical protein